MLKKLKEIRMAKGYTHQYMAGLLGISKAFYWQIENNKRNLSYRMAVKIAAIFELKPDDIFYEEQKKKND
ncbi:MAG: helix-turn-helix transcriptional regulator [Bacilli bacterium]|nr:helix-turn-helix transcriptional regulator [Bacilli bacterium]